MIVPRPLSGIRIVSLAQNVPGPVAIARLAAEGASVVKVEPPTGDPLAGMSRAWYDELHRHVAVAHLDLKMPRGQKRLRTLLQRADLLLVSHRPSALVRLGLDADSLAAGFPRLRWLSIVGEIDRPEVPGHDLTYQAEAGLLDAALPATLLADLMGAEKVVAAALLLLAQAPPARAQVGLLDSLTDLTAPQRFKLTSRGAWLGGKLPTYRVYETRRGHIAVAALEPHFRARLYEALDLPDGSPLDSVMRTRTAAQWERWARTRDLPMSALRSI